jgi:hypothetical protein
VNAFVIVVGLVLSIATIGALHVCFPPSDPMIPKVLS